MIEPLRKASAEIFHVSGSTEEDRPYIDFEDPENAQNDWGLVDEVLRSERPLSDLGGIAIAISDVGFEQWDFYSVPGTFGLFSERAVEAIPRQALKDFTLVAAQLGHRNYYFLKCDQRRVCLDLARSKVTRFASSPNDIKSVELYAFVPGSAPDPLMFCPAGFRRLFATDGVVKALQSAGCQGIRFTLVPQAA